MSALARSLFGGKAAVALLEEIIKRRHKARRLGSDQIFHRKGHGRVPECMEDRVREGPGQGPAALRSSAHCRARHDPRRSGSHRRHEDLRTPDAGGVRPLVADEDLRNAVIKTAQYLKDRRAEDDGEVAETGEPAGSR